MSEEIRTFMTEQGDTWYREISFRFDITNRKAEPQGTDVVVRQFQQNVAT